MASAYDRRNERARALGYRSYYDYRAHDNGRIAPGEPRLKGEALRRARGHAGASDLRRRVGPGDLVRAFPVLGTRRINGTYGAYDVEVKDFETGETREYRLQGQALRRRNIDRLIAALEADGAVLVPGYILEDADLST